MVKLAGVLALLSMAAEIAAIAVGASHGFSPAVVNAMNWGIGEQLMVFQAPWLAVLFSLGIIAPGLSLLAWLAMYSALAPGGAAALCGILATAFGFLLGVMAEVIRLSVTMTLPARYLAASEVARPAVLALGAFLSQLFQLLAMTSLILIYAVGMPLVAAAILKGRTLPRWLGWVLLLPSILAGYIGAPLLLLGYPIGGPFVGVGLNVFFIWFVVLAVVLLRWSPKPNVSVRLT